MAGLADWQIEMIYQLVDYGHHGVSGPEMAEIAERIIPLLENTQDYVWRRHLAAAAVRTLATVPEESDTHTVTVGFADLVGFTRASRRLSPAELTALLEDFQALATDVVATCGGRVVKTVGDEVLFCVGEPRDGAEIALRLLERLAESPSPLTTPPRLRVGVAIGEVVTRFGDVYGEAVNIAARLTANARPGRVLVDRNLAAALEGDDRFLLDSRRPLAVRGYRHLQQWELRRAG
jgi:adenylate cyclase